MTFDWPAFVASLVGTTIPGLIVSALLLFLNNKSSKSVEAYKVELSGQLTELQHILAHDEAKARLWHERRVDALVAIYLAFADYLVFLRRMHYVEGDTPPGMSLDPLWDFRRILEKNRLYLDDELHKFVMALDGELMQFWQFAVKCRRDGNSHEEVQRRLDYEVPSVLERLRIRVHEYADPAYTRA